MVLRAVALVLSGCTAHHGSAGLHPSPLRPTASAGTAMGSAAETPAASSAAALSSTAASSTSEPIQTTIAARPTKEHPCGVSSTADYAHVVWIWMENQGYRSVMGSSSAPFENSLAQKCGSATDYNGVSHPSLPNYLAATGGSTFGVTDDASPSAHRINADSIFAQVEQAGLTWRSYNESMPKNCDTASSGSYAVKHNPAAYYVAIRTACDVNDVPLEGAFDRDIAAGSLPSFSLVTPNLCNDTHDCAVAVGDAWLATWVPKILAGPNYSSGDTLVVVTWDEAEGSTKRIPTIVIGPSVPAGTVAGQRFDHYALLRTTEDLLGLPPLLAAASATSMAGAFDI
jgi:hypothetical protein